MIATQIEHGLRSGLLYPFRSSSLIESACLEIARFMEESVSETGLVPGKYLVFLPSNSHQGKDRGNIEYALKTFLRNFIKDAGYIPACKAEVVLRYHDSGRIYVKAIKTNDYKPSVEVVLLKAPSSYSGNSTFMINGSKNIIIGRAEKAGIRIVHDFISSHHLQLSIIDHDVCLVRDLSSTNGTVLKGKRLEPNKDIQVTLPVNIRLAGRFELLIRSGSR